MIRRKFIKKSSLLSAGGILASHLTISQILKETSKRKVALVGTGARGISFWGKPVISGYGDKLEFVGLCDINAGRLAYTKKKLQLNCPIFTDFDEMLKVTKPELVIVTTVDNTHHEFIIKAMEFGADVATEKPMTTNESACQLILDAQKKTGRKVHVGMNYRYGSFFSGIKEVLASGKLGKITSVDFHWYLNVYHGADYFRRWHRLKEKGGTLLVHKSSHHFDLVNWFLDSDPVEVFALGSLEHYGKGGPFRHSNCRPCPHKTSCQFYVDITKNTEQMELYVANERLDGYLRDGCVFKEDIDIYDKMSVQVKNANEVSLNYSLTTYSPYEGWRIAFNGTKGRLDATEGIPWEITGIDQSSLHAKEMEQGAKEEKHKADKIYLTTNFNPTPEVISVERKKGGHGGGGDARLIEAIFGGLNKPDPYQHAAGTRDGAMSVLIGVAARQSIDQKKIVKIEDLTKITPLASRP